MKETKKLLQKEAYNLSEGEFKMAEIIAQGACKALNLPEGEFQNAIFNGACIGISVARTSTSEELDEIFKRGAEVKVQICKETKVKFN